MRADVRLCRWGDGEMRPRCAQTVSGDRPALGGRGVIRQLEAVAAVICGWTKRHDIATWDIKAPAHRDLIGVTCGHSCPRRANGSGDTSKTLGDGSASHVLQAQDVGVDERLGYE